MDALTGRVDLLGLDFDDVSLEDAVARILARPAAAPFVYVVTPNADHLARLRRQPELRPLYKMAWLRLFDSRLLFNAAWVLRLRRPALCPGADLTAMLLSRLAGGTVTVIGLGGADMEALQRCFPSVVWRHYEPPQQLALKPVAFAAAVEFAVAAPSRIIFVALGSPLQERLAAAVAARPEARGIGLCIGAALHFAAGTARRAPPWMQSAGLEWLHRLARDPRRLARRYLLDDPPILAAMLAEAAKRGSMRRGR